VVGDYGLFHPVDMVLPNPQRSHRSMTDRQGVSMGDILIETVGAVAILMCFAGVVWLIWIAVRDTRP
jgi:hypothetical protein